MNEQEKRRCNSFEEMYEHYEKTKLDNFIASSKLEGICIEKLPKGETIETVLKRIKDRQHG